MKQISQVIVLTGGGSGGHVTPLLSLARELKAQRPDCQIVYIGSRGDSFDTLKNSAHSFDFTAFIKAGKFRRYHGRGWLSRLTDVKTLGLNIRDLGRLPTSISSSIRILRQFKPDVVFSKGGFVALPVGLAARMLKISLITHDSDASAGLANRIIGRWAVAHATGLPAKYYKYPAKSIAYVGIPLDGRIKKVTPKIQNEYKEQLGLPKNSRVLLLSGGGNGSKRLNDLMLAIAPHLLSADLGLQIVHITGRAHLATVKAGYRAGLAKPELKRVRTLDFSPDFYAYAGAADLVVGRAGATTLAELSAAGKACLVIPSPFLTGGHQLLNAQELEAADAAVMADETIEPDELLVIVSELLSNDHRRFELAKNLYGTVPHNAAAKLARLILATADGET